ncbi:MULTISPECIES: ATP-binding protein [unclassified Bradyrhizobium]|uniref:ATP-binding protein n=1 Tax=unclassified Bradyrhizobium TaxID=2631580 RepID=UPI001BAC6C1A|nr:MULTISPECIES: ATP-binding protein [unclassified Bradyrhizobium]MBR1203861.1 HAMP domain-containing protein [Bradyrhizobium sp. AUGA SZCCT0124]MBR1310252.1 HAMP domain-containing protein [Bradyrhizobium sp. AUGA SZCCT0051]MBR1340394.1 HAMP domain-containing protein [Bradyrhizobium sp. AUGA SZCCT0105]MBR1355001.1 HAMP domain-containing protein [Bradyrhizobium sp. AUGA SZCCT0045]
MTSFRARQKWRPSLGLVIFTVLASVAVLPLMGLFFFRLYDNQLIHQTQAELIAQSRVLAAIYAEHVKARLGDGIPLGATVPQEALPDPDDQVTPIRPALDLAGNDLLRRRPDALPAAKPADPAYVEIGTALMPIILETQKVTLAGFRILDPQGVVIAGRQEVGQSLALIEEVAAALGGQYSAALRIRMPDKPPPPIYSISRGVGVHVFSAMPVIVNDHVAGVIYTSRTPSNIFDHLYQERGKFLLATLAVLLATIAIGLMFSRTVTRPMRELVDRAVRIGRGDRNAFQPLQHYGTRELAQLSDSFLDMAQQLSRRSDYIATFSAHLTHELKSPLTSIRGAAELLQDSLQSKSDTLTRSEQQSFISNILGDVARLDAMSQRLRELARAESAPQNEQTSLSGVIANLKSRFAQRTIVASGDLDGPIGMSGEKALIVLAHLADNAFRHNAKLVQLEATAGASTVRVTVSNDGDAISNANGDKIFDAFFTTRRDSGGTGMGLAIAQAVMVSHGGTIRLLPASQGVAFALEFPAV